MSRYALIVSVLALATVPAASAASGPPPVGIVEASSGAGLYAANCSSCHGPGGEGILPPGRPGVGDLVTAGAVLGEERVAGGKAAAGRIGVRDRWPVTERGDVGDEFLDLTVG